MKLILLLFVIFSSFANEAGVVTNYEEHGENWEGTCNEGTSQSPIDIVQKTAEENTKLGLINKLPNLKSKFVFADQAVKFSAEEDGKGSTIVDDNGEREVYSFLQFHFHSPSEHTINGEFYDAEVHFVH